MLVAHRALGALLDDLAGAAGATARLARDHRATPMAGRTLLQLAEPVTFGMTAAGWLVALDEAADRLREVRRARLAVQVGGPVGRPVAYQEKLALRLDLASPLLPWHTNRLRIADLAGALGGAAGVIGKVARDITLLAQSEVAEVSEASPGASSAMAHKRNPIAAVMAVSCAMQAPGLVATLLAAMIQEHGRAAGAWHAEWRPQRELLISTGSAAAWLRASLGGLRIHPDAMAANLGLLDTADVEGGMQAATVFVDRALAAHETREGL
jgi:3-carboxy-cis,cis-muconate cycloisomerase